MYCSLTCSNCLLASALMPHSLDWSIKSFITSLALIALIVFSSKMYLSRETRTELLATLDTGVHFLVSMSFKMLMQCILRAEQSITLTARKLLIRMDSYMLEHLRSSGCCYHTFLASKLTFQMHITLMNL